MKLLVILENFESIVAEEDVRRVREMVKDKIGEIRNSDKVIDSGVLADTRGAFLLVDVDSAGELSRLLFPMQDIARIETRPVYSFDELERMFAEAEEAGA